MKQNKKLNISGRVLCFIMLAAMLCSLLSVGIFAAESAGEGIEWSFSGNTLTISGSGEMRDFTENDTPPWHKHRGEIRTVIIQDGVTSVGNLAFYKYENIVSVTLPNSVKKIGIYAFSDCLSLEMISLGSGLEVIEKSAFARCESLVSIRLPESLKSIGDKAFYRCESLVSVHIPSSVQSLGDMIFTYCSGLTGVSIDASVDVIPEWMFYQCESLAEVVVGESIKSADSQAFYGCESFTSLYHPTGDAQELIDSIKETSIESFSSENVRNDTPTNNELEGAHSSFKDNTLIHVEKKTTQTNGAIITTVITEESTFENSTLSDPMSTVRIDALIDSESGFDDLLATIWGVIDKKLSSDGYIYVYVNLQIEGGVPNRILKDLAGKKVQIDVQAADGSFYGVDCERIKDDTVGDGSYSAGCDVQKNETLADTYKDILEGADTYDVTYNNDVNVNFSSGIYVGKENSHSIATIYKVDESGELERLQSAVIDLEGKATFYLESVTSDTKLVLGVNVKGETIENAIIPDEMAVDQYGLLQRYKPIEYAITAEREFMGMNSGQFALMVFGVVAGIVIIVTIVAVIIYRKKRLEMMYKLKAANPQ